MYFLEFESKQTGMEWIVYLWLVSNIVYYLLFANIFELEKKNARRQNFFHVLLTPNKGKLGQSINSITLI
jgi:hypothetical protein